MPAIVMFMALFTGVIVLHHGGHDPRATVVELYDDPEPPTGFDVLAVETLAASDPIVGPVIGPRHRIQDDIHVIEQPRATKRQMQVRARVEDDQPAVWIENTRMLNRHNKTVRTDADETHPTRTAPLRVP